MSITLVVIGNISISTICNYLRLRFSRLSSRHVLTGVLLSRSITNIYHKGETSERSVFLFFYGMLKSSFCGRLFGRSPSGRAFRCKSSLCCGLSPAIPNVDERAFTVLRLNLGHGLFRPGVRFRPFREAAWPKPDIGRKDKRNTSVRAVTRGFGCSPNPPVPRPA